MSAINNQQETPSKPATKRSVIPPITLPRRSSISRMAQKARKSSAHSRTSSIHSSFTDNDKKPIVDGTVRYLNTRHGFEIQRYSSSNWLSIDLLTKDACEAEEKSFREMLDKKEQVETLSKSIYTSEYYRQRWEDLLQSYKDGFLTHDEWAKQNYQLYCLKIFYIQACEREQCQLNSNAQDIRYRRAQCVFNQWKEAKSEGNLERQANPSRSSTSHQTTEVISVLSNPLPSSSSPNVNTTTKRTSISTNIENDFEQLPLRHFIPRKKPVVSMPESSYMFDEKRWSLNAMLKRVVGLDQPLPPPPKIIHRQYSSLTHLSNDSEFESGH